MASSPSPPPQPPPPQISDHHHLNDGDEDDDLPLGVPLLLPAPPLPQPQPSTRRLPPPCWTPDETAVLIDAYREKWYSLRRGNLRAAHWQDVADEIHRLCPNVSPPKTAVQCRHKMEKLRKRYRAELQRAKSIPHHRFSSSWVYFSKMEAMEKGNDNNNGNNNVVASICPVNVVFNDDLVKNSRNSGGFGGDFYNDNDNDDDNGNGNGNGNDDEDDVVNDEDYNNRISVRNDFQRNGLKIRIAGNSLKNYGGFEHISNPNPNPRFVRYNEFATPPPPPSQTPSQFEEGVRFASRVLKNDGGGGSSSGMGMGMGMNVMTKKRSTLGKRMREKERGKGRDGLAAMEMAEAIQVMGDGFLRVEKMKMDMVRESERERMEYELKRTQMILESQRRLVEAFAKGWSEVIANNEDHDDHDHDHDHDNDDDAKNNNKDES